MNRSNSNEAMKPTTKQTILTMQLVIEVTKLENGMIMMVAAMTMPIIP